MLSEEERWVGIEVREERYIHSASASEGRYDEETIKVVKKQRVASLQQCGKMRHQHSQAFLMLSFLYRLDDD